MTETEIAALSPYKKAQLATEFLRDHDYRSDGRRIKEVHPEQARFEQRIIPTPVGGKSGFCRHRRYK